MRQKCLRSAEQTFYKKPANRKTVLSVVQFSGIAAALAASISSGFTAVLSALGIYLSLSTLFAELKFYDLYLELTRQYQGEYNA